MAVSRRTMLLAGGAVVAGGVAIPTGRHLTWGGRDFTRPDYNPDYPDAPAGEESWMNWSGVECATPQAINLPVSEDELGALIAGTNGRVRPFGSGHSFSGLVPSEGMMVDVSRLTGMQSIDAETGVAVFGAGTRLFQMATELAGVRRALPNCRYDVRPCRSFSPRAWHPVKADALMTYLGSDVTQGDSG